MRGGQVQHREHQGEQSGGHPYVAHQDPQKNQQKKEKHPSRMEWFNTVRLMPRLPRCPSSTAASGRTGIQSGASRCHSPMTAPSTVRLKPNARPTRMSRPTTASLHLPINTLDHEIRLLGNRRRAYGSSAMYTVQITTP